MNVVMVLWVCVTIALILLILIQKGKGGGLSGAFGGLLRRSGLARADRPNRSGRSRAG